MFDNKYFLLPEGHQRKYMVSISFLNHASILIDINGVKILTDPWFEGTAFEGGWGLRKNNSHAYEEAAKADYLWISHFHSDHFHVPTLKKLLALNPGMKVLGNSSYNFQLDNAMKGVGFNNIIPFYERETTQLEGGVELTRYPTTGIDNMLLIKTKDFSILNYNDCNLPNFSQRWLKKTIGDIDVLLTNFNHAGKLLLYPYPDNNIIRNKLISAFKNNYEIFSPRYILPFASYHFYRASESNQQNNSMLVCKDLEVLDTRILAFNIGDKVSFNPDDKSFQTEVSVGGVDINEIDVLAHKQAFILTELQTSAAHYVKDLRQKYGPLTWFLPELTIHISDLDTTVALHRTKGLYLTDKPAQIGAHSESLQKWWTKIYGTDGFIVGAHLTISSKDKVPVYWQIIMGMLIDNKLDLKSIFKMVFTRKGIQFLWNRKEEIIGIMTSFKVAADYHKEE